MSENFHHITHLHQVLIVDSFDTPRKLPPLLRQQAARAQQLYPKARYKLWSGNDLRDFLAKEFDREVLNAFDTLVPYSYKCDLARYCLMYVYGGIYFDLAINMMTEWRIPLRYGVAAFTEIYDGMDCWACVQTSLLWSLPKREEWRFAIDQIVQNCKNKFYGPHDHYPTAGALLGRSFSAAMALKGQAPEADDQFIGEVRYITPERQNQNVTYVSPFRDLVGIRNKLKAGDISALGVTGSNNYCQLWKAKQVYGEKGHLWHTSEKHIVLDGLGKKTPKGIYVHKGKGRIFYGPYVDLPAGNYKLTLKFTPDTVYKKFFLDVARGSGKPPVKEYNVEYNNIEKRHKEEFFFILRDNEESLEFRMNVFGDFIGCIESIYVENITEYNWSYSHYQIVPAEVGTLNNDGIEVSQSSHGRVSYGPFVDLPPGRYKLEVIFSDETIYQNLQIDITENWNDKKLFSLKTNKPSISQSSREDYYFQLDDYKNVVEFNIFVFGDFAGTIKGFNLVKENSIGIESKTSEQKSRKKLFFQRFFRGF